jgi:hypothetical protein
VAKGVRKHSFSAMDLATFYASPFVGWMEVLDKLHAWHEAEPDHSLAFYQQDHFVTPNPHSVLHQRLMGKTGGMVDIDPGGYDAERHLSTQNAMGTGVGAIANGFLLDMPMHGRLDFLVRQEPASQLGNFHYLPAMLATQQYDPAIMPVELCCFVDMLEHVQGLRPSECWWITDSQEDNPQITRIASEDWMFDYRQLKLRYRKMLANFDQRAVPDPRDSSEWGRWSGYARQLIAEETPKSG